MFNYAAFCFLLRAERMFITIRSTSTVTKIMVERGLNSGVRPPLRASAYMYVESVSKPSVPMVNIVTAKSSIESVIESKNPEITPGIFPEE